MKIKIGVGVILFTALAIWGIGPSRHPFLWQMLNASAQEESHAEADHEHEEADHEEADHDHAHEAESISLDDAALFNIGIGEDGTLTLETLDYQKSFRLPGEVRAIPGRSINHVAALVSGIVTRIEARQGETLCPGAPLFEIMLMHEDAIVCQTELIALLQKRDVLQMEIDRLSSLAEGTAPKQQRELQLEKITNDAAIVSQQNLLKIHGFTDEMIDETIVKNRQTITKIVVRVPEIQGDGFETPTAAQHTGEDHNEHFLLLDKLLVNRGDSVQMGDILCRVSDMRSLQIEGKAFAADENIVNLALLEKRPVSAIFPDPVKLAARQRLDGLTIERTDSFIDPSAQTISCWVNLPNERLDEESGIEASTARDTKTIHWRFKPGQRCELEIAYETLPDVFVLPPDAVATDKSAAFVFELTDVHEGKRVWTKRSARVLYRANDAVVIAPDETIRPGIKIAATGAEQLYIALGSGSGKLQSACGHDH